MRQIENKRNKFRIRVSKLKSLIIDCVFHAFMFNVYNEVLRKKIDFFIFSNKSCTKRLNRRSQTEKIHNN